MHLWSRHSGVILLVYLLGGALIELTHHEAAMPSLDERPVVATHGCGEKERHLPLDQARPCLACSPLAQRLAVSCARFIGIEPARVVTILVSFVFLPASQPILTSCGKRGPPAIV